MSFGVGRAARAVVGPCLAGAALALTGCGSMQSINPFAVDELPCPYVRLLTAGESYSRSGASPAESAAAKPEFEARFLSVDYQCSYNENDGKPVAMTFELALLLVARRQETGQPAQETVPYFIAVVAPDKTILQKRVLDAVFDFPADANEMVLPVPERIQIDMPLKPDAAGWQHEIVISFQLTPEQLERQRSR